MSYWEHHAYSTQSRKSILKVIGNAGIFFGLSQTDMEALANKAGLSLHEHKNVLEKLRQDFNGTLKSMYENASVSERMFRMYKTREPAKHALLAVLISLELPYEKIDEILRCYGYCLSESLANDMVVTWFIKSHQYRRGGVQLLVEINEVLHNMGFPLLMTRLKE